MHLIGMSFEEAKILSKAISEGLATGCQVIITEINTFIANPNAPGISNTAKKQVTEWNQSGYDSNKIQGELKDWLKKATKASKQLIKNCNEELYKQDSGGIEIFNW